MSLPRADALILRASLFPFVAAGFVSLARAAFFKLSLAADFGATTRERFAGTLVGFFTAPSQQLLFESNSKRREKC
jgi:hypothetical protein